MVKKKNVRRRRAAKIDEEEPEILDEKERKNMEYIFLALFAASIVFLFIYLGGLISILLRHV